MLEGNLNLGLLVTVFIHFLYYLCNTGFFIAGCSEQICLPFIEFEACEIVETDCNLFKRLYSRVPIEIAPPFRGYYFWSRIFNGECECCLGKGFAVGCCYYTGRDCEIVFAGNFNRSIEHNICSGHCAVLVPTKSNIAYNITLAVCEFQTISWLCVCYSFVEFNSNVAVSPKLCYCFCRRNCNGKLLVLSENGHCCCKEQCQE